MQGQIFSIEEFSTFDGPGIRTTVFLKGCPLKCMWCHNPEGQNFASQLMRSFNGCLHCGACTKAGMEATGTPCLTEESITACPRNLIRWCGEAVLPEELVQRLDKLLWMLNSSGGGITFSGGEPLSQPEFLLECLMLLNGKTHRAVQTSGYASEAVFRKVLSHCDYMLFDLKHMDHLLHRKYTGVSNEPILRNYRILAQSDVPFITRIPLIPGVNDTADNLTATAMLLQSLQVNRIELLPYNTGAGAKYASVGMSYSPTFDPTVTPNPHKEIFLNYGIEVHVL